MKTLKIRSFQDKAEFTMEDTLLSERNAINRPKHTTTTDRKAVGMMGNPRTATQKPKEEPPRKFSGESKLLLTATIVLTPVALNAANAFTKPQIAVEAKKHIDADLSKVKIKLQKQILTIDATRLNSSVQTIGFKPAFHNDDPEKKDSVSVRAIADNTQVAGEIEDKSPLTLKFEVGTNVISIREKIYIKYSVNLNSFGIEKFDGKEKDSKVIKVKYDSISKENVHIVTHKDWPGVIFIGEGYGKTEGWGSLTKIDDGSEVIYPIKEINLLGILMIPTTKGVLISMKDGTAYRNLSTPFGVEEVTDLKAVIDKDIVTFTCSNSTKTPKLDILTGTVSPIAGK